MLHIYAAMLYTVVVVNYTIIIRIPKLSIRVQMLLPSQSLASADEIEGIFS